MAGRNPELEAIHSEKKRKPRTRNDICAHAGAEQRQREQAAQQQAVEHRFKQEDVEDLHRHTPR